MELCDIYDAQGRRTGKVAVRGSYKRNDGEYLLAVHIMIRNSNGEFLIQKRSDKKRSLPGKWNLTSGMVKSGEDSRGAAMREVYEEIGISLDKTRAIFGGCVILHSLLADIWLFDADFEIADCKLEPDEVSEVKWVDKDALYSLLENAASRTPEYIQIAERLMDMAFSLN